MNKWLGLALILGLAGCPKKKEAGLTQNEAQSLGDALSAGIEDSAKSYGAVKDGAGADEPCATLSGNTADADLDNIPASATVTYNCTAMALGYTGTLNGTMSVTDDAPNVAAWAFTGGANLHATLTGPFGGTAVRDWDGMIVATQTTNFALHRTLDVVTVWTAPGGDGSGGLAGRQTTVTEDNDWTITYTPMVTWMPGSIVVTGSLTATGQWNFTINEFAGMATLATPTPLTLDPNCATRITAGTVTGAYMDDDMNDHTVTVTWTGCGARTVTKT